MQSRLRVSSSDSTSRIRLERLFDKKTKHFLFLGSPGAGKTTSMKHLCHRLLADSSFAGGRDMFPILVKLRDLDRKGARDPLLLELASSMGIKFEFHESLSSTNSDAQRIRTDALTKSICAILESTQALLILDGLDEISDPDVRSIVVEEIRRLASKLKGPTIVFTCRTGEILFAMEKVQVFEICPLNDEQIRSFANKWLRCRDRADEFLSQVKASPFSDSAIKPLNLAHLCALYERSGAIPEKPKTVYKKILNLLLNDWDEQRSVRRQSRYSSFGADRKYEFLSTLGYHLTVNYGKLTFNTQVIQKIYGNIHKDFGLPRNEGKEVAKEVESHTGLLMQCGLDEYMFAHKSLHEFLTAEFIVRLPTIPSASTILAKIPNELAIAVSTSSNPSLYFTELVFRVFLHAGRRLASQFYGAFVARLVQEKPDFNGSSSVVLALLTLYSTTLDIFSNHTTSTDEHQPSLFLMDPLMMEFEQLVNLVIENNQVRELDQYYTLRGETDVWFNQGVLAFQRHQKHAIYQLPSTIYVRTSFANRVSRKIPDGVL